MDKESFLKALIKEGYNADFYNNGIPTVFITDSAEFRKTDSGINRLRKALGYNQSYGISLSYNRQQQTAVAV